MYMCVQKPADSYIGAHYPILPMCIFLGFLYRDSVPSSPTAGSQEQIEVEDGLHCFHCRVFGALEGSATLHWGWPSCERSSEVGARVQDCVKQDVFETCGFIWVLELTAVKLGFGFVEDMNNQLYRGSIG